MFQSAPRSDPIAATVMLSDAQIEAIAQRIAEIIRSSPPESVIPMREAMRRCGFGSPQGFQRWARHMGLTSLSGGKGRYSVAAIDAAIARASRLRHRRLA
jgi:hypothetical protein